MKPTKEKLFYFDCEWVPISNSFMDLKMDHYDLAEVFEHQVEKWTHNNKRDGKPVFDGLDEWWEEKAHFHPEFCKIICVSYGYFKKSGEFEIQSVYGDDEKKLLSGMQLVLDKVNIAGMFLSGYMIKRFDMPWLSKRMMINGIKPPSNICVYDKKPWEVDVFDLPEVWGQGNMQESYTPFELTCTALGIKSSKDDLSGKEVKEAYYNGELERIKTYCEKDVQKSMELASKLIELLP